MSNVRFVQQQHPVGQGGFHSGWLFNGASPVFDPFFSWVYDCGSDQISVLRAELLSMRGAPLDMLFLSHLDDDHVIGVDTLLMAASRIDQVVLPYLNDVDWALHLAAGASAGTLSGTFIDLASDPSDWFGRRGVSRIVYVQATEDGGDSRISDPIVPDDPDLTPDGELPERPGPFKAIWSQPLRAHQAGSAKGQGAEILVAQPGAVASINSAGRTLNWVLSPFAYKPSSKQMAIFRSRLEREFGCLLTATQYASAALTGDGRKKLRRCYDRVWRKHNLHSMTLYSGPAVDRGAARRNTAWHGPHIRRVVKAGWLSTGDFDLSVRKRRDDLIRYYSRYRDLVGQLNLPHHGSEHSFDASLLSAHPNLSSVLAAVGANGHGHPSLSVQLIVGATPRLSFVRVDESPSSSFKVAGPVG